MTIARMILNQLFTNDEYARRVTPYLKDEYFEKSDKLLLAVYRNFIEKYNATPTIEAFRIELQKIPRVQDEVIASLNELYEKTDVELEWMIDQTEKYCRDQAIHSAIMESISIIDGKHKTLTENAIPEILSDALAVTFDNSIGHDYVNDSDSRFDFYHRKEARVAFDLELFNKITNGGLPKKTLTTILAATGVGKSLFMCHMASSTLVQGLNVLYITLEMAEERIAERVDANLMNIPIQQIENLPKDVYDSKIEKICHKNIGRLIIKEYPTSVAHVGHFRALLNDLKIKKEFIPDIIFIDYLNICASSRIKTMGGSINSYSYVKSIAEEIRGLAVEYNVPIVTATQTTRSGATNSDVEITDTSESFGVPATSDLMFAVISTEELEKLGQLMIKQLKNRYTSPDQNRRFLIGVDRSRMKLYDVEPDAQTLIETSADPKHEKKSFESFLV